MQASRPGAVASASDGGTGATPLPTPRFLKTKYGAEGLFQIRTGYFALSRGRRDHAMGAAVWHCRHDIHGGHGIGLRRC